MIVGASWDEGVHAFPEYLSHILTYTETNKHVHVHFSRKASESTVVGSVIFVVTQVGLNSRRV